ncbi:hypothetical protein G7078_08465 [Sphingomonas sinipercae]|uniref:Uncharacterized protein n=1 Tax=Sphingomonas sinipercae TaxID=2714944 RepID=A0A6G7ZPB7_9SPHN|nr:hypothetical protein [Sphingomonas sinipercae]QIL02811.1 hypothetical protein G7078_08465 [Sphingomonas sinipercae]
MVNWTAVGALTAVALVHPKPAIAKVVAVQLDEHKPWLDGKVVGPAGAYEILRGTVRYELDPNSAEAAQVTDIRLAPVNARGNVEYSGPFLLLRPIDSARSNGATLIEIPNRGMDQTNGALFESKDFELVTPNAKDLGRAGIFERGTTFAWVGWQGRLKANEFGLAVPIGRGTGMARADYNWFRKAMPAEGVSLRDVGFYCAADTRQTGSRLVRKTSFDDPGTALPPGLTRKRAETCLPAAQRR